MNTNIETITQLIDYIEEHLHHTLTLDNLAEQVGYSKYHLHKMFGCIVGMSIHSYVQRRRLSEAAKELIESDKSIMEIAFDAGYETQRSFTKAFKDVYQLSPKAYMRKGSYWPVQLKACIDATQQLRGDLMLDVNIHVAGPTCIVGYSGNTKWGFKVIGKCHHLLNKHMKHIPYQVGKPYLVGINDYQNFVYEKKQQAFDYYAGVEVTNASNLLKGMVTKTLEKKTYVVFHYRGCSKDSMEPVVEYVYRVWFPKTTYRLDDTARYDLVHYYLEEDEDGKSALEYWIPIQPENEKLS